ncbi:MAG: hypothetical protein AAF515_22215 [Pseudomonadota bacterium]
MLAPGLAVADDEGRTGTTLAGDDVRLPLHDAAHVMLISFTRAAGSQSEAWLRELDDAGFEVPVFPVVVLAGAPGFVRRMVVRGIRGDVPKALHERFVIVHKHHEPWRRLAADADDEQIQVLLVTDPAAEPMIACYRAQGAATEAAIAELLTAAGCDLDPA